MSAHEVANMKFMAQAMGKEVFDAAYRMQDGSSSYDYYMNQGNNQQFTGNQMRYANEQVNQFNGAQYSQQPYSNPGAQGQNQFSGYGSQVPNYSVNSNREFTVNQQTGTATSEYYNRLPKVAGKAIVATHKDGRGNIEAFRLEDGTILPYDQMMSLIANGNQSGLRLQQNREGELIIRSVPDGFTDNNLDNLPQF